MEAVVATIDENLDEVTSVARRYANANRGCATSLNIIQEEYNDAVKKLKTLYDAEKEKICSRNDARDMLASARERVTECNNRIYGAITSPEVTQHAVDIANCVSVEHTSRLVQNLRHRHL